jgi:hypothetical protein
LQKVKPKWIQPSEVVKIQLSGLQKNDQIKDSGIEQTGILLTQIIKKYGPLLI